MNLRMPEPFLNKHGIYIPVPISTEYIERLSHHSVCPNVYFLTVDVQRLGKLPRQRIHTQQYKSAGHIVFLYGPYSVKGKLAIIYSQNFL
jgi:hypothetical protein